MLDVEGTLTERKKRTKKDAAKGICVKAWV